MNPEKRVAMGVTEPTAEPVEPVDLEERPEAREQLPEPMDLEEMEATVDRLELQAMAALEPMAMQSLPMAATAATAAIPERLGMVV